ncbi:hypothetical protein E4U21_007722 [Claviceps maximensis]|nr:hypothetical protein E4U21_007722 [Claviceps maximensis]
MGERQPQQRDRAIPQLSCALCRDRKLKCDKLDPCTNCTTSGVTCEPVYRPRLPRGRHARRSRKNSTSTSTPPPQSTDQRPNAIDAGSGAGMLQPIDNAENLTISLDPASCPGRLEALVQDYDVLETMDDSLQEDKEDSNTSSSNTTNVAQLVATSLPQPSSGEPELFDGNVHRDESGYVAQSRQLFSHFMHGGSTRGEHGTFPRGGAYREEADMDDVRQEDHDRDELDHLDLLGLSNQRGIRTPNSAGFTFEDRSSMSQLCKVYLRNVDPVIKILHRPSLSTWMLDGNGYLGYPEDHTSIQALESAVCYAAANTLSEVQCQAMFRTSKPTMVSTYRRKCEMAFERAGLLTTRCIVILQSFVLYLVGRRAEEECTAVWTLVAVAVKITVAMGLNQDQSQERAAESFFHQQMRLRLWLTICLLDLQASIAQLTKPLIGYRDAKAAVSKVRHINDFDFDFSTSMQVPDREELTETTLALVMYRTQAAGRLLDISKVAKLNGVPDSTSDISAPAWADFPNPQQRREYISQFQHEVLALVHFCDPESSPYAWYTWHSTQYLLSAMRLSQSISCQLSSDAHAPAIPSSSLRGSNTDLLRNSLHILYKSQLLYSDTRGEGFRWHSITIPWLALSTAIAECNTCTDIPLMRRIWPLIEASYQRYAPVFLNNTGATTPCPIAVAMSQAREKLSSRLQACNLSEQSSEAVFYDGGTSKATTQSFPYTFDIGSSRIPIQTPLESDPHLLNDQSSSSHASHDFVSPMFVQNKRDPDFLSLEYNTEFRLDMCNSDMCQISPPEQLCEPFWMVGDMMTAYSNWWDEAMVRNSDTEGELRGLYYGSSHIGF